MFVLYSVTLTPKQQIWYIYGRSDVKQTGWDLYAFTKIRQAKSGGASRSRLKCTLGRPSGGGALP